MTPTDFLLARIAEDERHARKLAETDRRPVLSLALTVNHPERILLECEAKRQIVATYLRASEHVDKNAEAHARASSSGDQQGITALRTHGWQLAGRREALEAVIKALALPYADHPDYREEWKP